MTANEALDNYMSALSPRERIAKARDLCELGNIRKWTLSDWRRGRTKIPLLWQRKISEIFGYDVFADADV